MADQAFLDAMQKKLDDPRKPQFTATEVALCYRLVMGEEIADDDPFITQYCLPHFNVERNDLCLYK